MLLPVAFFSLFIRGKKTFNFDSWFFWAWGSNNYGSSEAILSFLQKETKPTTAAEAAKRRWWCWWNSKKEKCPLHTKSTHVVRSVEYLYRKCFDSAVFIETISPVCSGCISFVLSFVAFDFCVGHFLLRFWFAHRWTNNSVGWVKKLATVVCQILKEVTFIIYIQMVGFTDARCFWPE